MRVHRRSQTLIFKIVYYGPGLSGKTTNLVRLHESVPDHARGKMIQLDTETERTLFFDYFPLSLGRLGSYKVRIHFFTVPGQSFYNVTRRTVLQGADGVVFVADSAPRREHANLLALRNMYDNFEALGRDTGDLPLVFQWNKRDLPDAMPLPLMERLLNPEGLPSVAASASTGEGVQLTQAYIVRAVMEQIRRATGGPGVELTGQS